MRCSNLHRLSFIVWSSVAFVGLGVAYSIMGPTLLDLAARLRVGVTAMSSMFTVRAMGAVTGSVVSGVLLDRKREYSYAIVSASILVCIISLCIIPYSIHLAMMGVFTFICGVSLGALDNACNTILLRLWRTGSGPSMQLLHFAFGVGAVLAPLLAEPFISSELEDPVTNLTCSQVNLTAGLDGFNTSCLSQLFDESCVADRTDGSHGNQTFIASNCTLTHERVASLRFAYAYLLGAFTFVLPLIAFTYHSVRSEFGRCYQRRDSLSDQLPGVHSKDHPLLDKPHLLFKIFFFPGLFLFICLYCGIETSFGNLIFTFAVESLHFTKQNAALLNAVFWGSFMVARFFAIFVAYTKIPSSVIIAVDTVGSTLSLLVMTIFLGNDVVVWVGTAALGTFMASIYPTTMSWLSEQVEVSGKAVAVITTGATLGDMSLPLTAGALIAQVSPSTLVPFALVATAAYMLVGFLLQLVTFCERRRRRKRSVGVAYNLLKDNEPGLELADGGADSVPSPEPEVDREALGKDMMDSDALHSCQADSNTHNPEETHSDTHNPEETHSDTHNPEETCTKSDPNHCSVPNRDLQSSPG